MWGTEVARRDGPVPFLVYEQRRRRVTELLDDAARWADRDHLVQGDRRVTFAAMIAAADRVAGHLSARGLGPGDRLLLLAANSPEWVISLWAGLRLGAVVAPGNRWWSTDEIAHAIELTAPAVIIADTEMTRLLPAGTGQGAGPAVVPVADIRAAESAPPLPVPEPPTGSEDDPALTAREVSAADALAIGLLDRVTEPGGALKPAFELAAQFGVMSRPALAAVLSCVDDAGELSLTEGMAREADRVTDLLDSPDGREGLAAFVAKRPARFS